MQIWDTVFTWLNATIVAALESGATLNTTFQVLSLNNYHSDKSEWI